VIGLTPSIDTARRLALVWGVHALVTDQVFSMTEAVNLSVRLARQEGFVQAGEELVVVAGVPFGQSGSTNALRVAKV
jgi:pyruvate kinase